MSNQGTHVSLYNPFDWYYGKYLFGFGILVGFFPLSVNPTKTSILIAVVAIVVLALLSYLSVVTYRPSGKGFLIPITLLVVGFLSVVGYAMINRLSSSLMIQMSGIFIISLMGAKLKTKRIGFQRERDSDA